jgi:xylan 1,4-beta-xylosidase
VAVLKLQWQFSAIHYPQDYELKNGLLKMAASPEGYRVIHAIVGDHAYEASVKLEPDAGVEAGLAAFYSDKMFAGIGTKDGTLLTYSKGVASFGRRTRTPNVKYFKLRLIDFDLQMFSSEDGKTWKAYPDSLEVSGYNHNVLGGFSSLKIAIVVRGRGSVKIDDFTYRSLE